MKTKPGDSKSFIAAALVKLVEDDEDRERFLRRSFRSGRNDSGDSIIEHSGFAVLGVIDLKSSIETSFFEFTEGFDLFGVRD